MSRRRPAALLGVVLTACTPGGGEPPAAQLPVPTTAPAPVAPPGTVGGARVPGELPAGARMESSSVVEVPASAAGLRAAFRSPSRPDQQAVVRLD